MSEREVILEWLKKTFPECTYHVWNLYEGVSEEVRAEWMVTITRPATTRARG